MRTGKLGRLAGMIVAAAAVLALGGVSMLPGTAAAQTSGPRSVASVGCAPAAGNWTDCTLTLNQSVPAGHAISVSLADQSGSVAFCWGGTDFDIATTTVSIGGDYSSSDSTSLGCATNGHVTTFNCTVACAAGSNLILSVLGASSSNLAQSFSVGVS